jgi:signal transduction histidine kinase
MSVEVNGGSQPSGLKSADGKLWFPTMGGVAIVDPVAFRDLTPPPAAVIEEVRLGGEPVDLSGGVTIPSTFSAFDIQYTAPSFIKPRQVRFRYRLVGLDDDWVEAGDRRFASFYRIPPGKYRFVVTASSHSGVWNTDGQSLDIIILPPFWRTWWFMSLASIGFMSIALAAHEHRMRRVRAEHRRQLAFSQQLIDSQENERRRLSNEMHDSLGQHVTIIKKRTQTARENIIDRHRVAVELAEIGILAEQMKVEMKAIGHDLRPYHLDKIGLSKTIEKMAQRVGRACDLNVATDIAPIDDILPEGSQIHIYRIVQESLHNIVKHANATQVRVTVERGASAIQITVRDNGHGFDAEPGDAAGPTDRGFGLMSIRERARILGGEVAVRSGKGQGTTIVATFNAEGPAHG